MTALAETTVEPIHVNVDFFERWCRSVGLHPCLRALRALLIVERAGIQQGLSSIGSESRNPEDLDQ